MTDPDPIRILATLPDGTDVFASNPHILTRAHLAERRAVCARALDEVPALDQRRAALEEWLATIDRTDAELLAAGVAFEERRAKVIEKADAQIRETRELLRAVVAKFFGNEVDDVLDRTVAVRAALIFRGTLDHYHADSLALIAASHCALDQAEEWIGALEAPEFGFPQPKKG